MSITRHVYEVYIKATPDQVWQAIIDPDFTRRYFHHTAVESTFEQGEGYRYVMADGSPAIEGVIEDIEPGRRLTMSFRFLYEASLAAEPPSRVEWVVTPAGDATRLTLRHVDLFQSPLTWERVRMGWLPVLHGMKTLLETGDELGEIDDDEATTHADDPEGEWHRAQGIAANNGTWEWLGKPVGERTVDDDEQMTRSAYASAYHWSRASGAGPANAARANWLLSRVWVVRANGPLALTYADATMDLCREHGLADFDLAYAHEARARALACLGRHDEARPERDAAAAVAVADEEDRNLVASDLAAEPWFDM